MAVKSQRSFSGGEIAPSLYARVDTVKYETGVRTLRNYFVMRHGGAQSRAGSEFVAEVSDSTATVRTIPFIFNASQTYVLEFGNLYMRVHLDGVQQTEAATIITDITEANPGVVTTSGSHGYSNGDEVFISGVAGMTQVNNRNLKVADVTATTFELQTMDSVDLDTSGYTAYVSEGTAEKVYEIVTPYTTADLADLHYVQSADVITIVHSSYAPRELARTGHTSWSLSTISFKPQNDFPTVLAATGTAGAVDQDYRVTAIDNATSEESLPGTEATNAITDITQADPGVVTTGTHGYANGDHVYIQAVVGMTEVNNRTVIVSGSTSTTFQLVDLDGNNIDTTGYTAYSSAGTAGRIDLQKSLLQASSSDPITLTWTAAAGASEYNIYKAVNGVYGFIGTSATTSFADVGATPDTSDTPPKDSDIFLEAGDFPSTVSYIQQRRSFANTTNEPETTWMSKIGQFSNFTKSRPLQADDSIKFSLAGRQVNEVEHLLDIGRMVVMTSGSEITVNGDDAGVITSTTINNKTHSYNGSSSVRPLVISGNALYVQARGSIVRDLGFDFQVDGYRGNDLTIFSAHLLDGFTITDWAYQQIPHSIVWAVRSDGALIGLTYVNEQQMLAWHRHDFGAGATAENVVVIPDGDEDAVYVTVKRTIDGRTTRYIERISTRQLSDIKDFKGMDSSLSYDGRNTGATTMTLSGGTTWEYDETLTATASGAQFFSTDVGNAINIRDGDGNLIRFTIEAYTSATIVTGKPDKTVPTSLRAVAVTDWDDAVDQLSGLWHLEGETVSVFADGFVVGSPNNPEYTTVTVADGTITLDKPFGVIHVGLPITADFETLDIDTPNGETLSDKNMLITAITIFFEKTRGIFAGSKPPTDDTVDPLEDLNELKLREQEGYDSPVDLVTDKVDINVHSLWNSNGRVFIRQVDPLPSTILAVHPSGFIPVRSE